MDVKVFGGLYAEEGMKNKLRKKTKRREVGVCCGKRIERNNCELTLSPCFMFLEKKRE
jgi:hypothetical protein